MFDSLGNMPIFINDRVNRPLNYTLQRFASAIAYFGFQTRFTIADNDLDQLVKLKGKRVVFLANHPMPNDGIHLFILSAKLNDRFHFMVAHEQFRGFKRWILPRIGAYSIRRGGWGDKSSALRTLEILSQPSCRIVIFPEGRCSFMRNDVFAFQQGAIRLGFQALEKSQQSAGCFRDLYIVPLVIRYPYLDDINFHFDQNLRRLEIRLETSSQGSLGDRLRRVTCRVVTDLERDNLQSVGASRHCLRTRLGTLVKAILERPTGDPIDLSGLTEEERDALLAEAKGMWADHSEITDSVGWVRELWVGPSGGLPENR